MADPRSAAPGWAAEWRAAGHLGAVEPLVVDTLARLAGESDPDVLRACALAVRAPQHGHIGAPLSREVAGESALSWSPGPSGWERLRASPLVRPPGDPRRTPFVLVGDRILTDRAWRLEDELGSRWRTRARAQPEAPTSGAPEILSRLFRGVELDDRQRLAAAMALCGLTTVVSGGPGTGKTYTVKRILALLLEDQLAKGEGPALRVALAAPTGKAAGRLTEAMTEGLDELAVAPETRETLAGLRAVTVHRLVGIHPDRPDEPRHGPDRPLPFDVIVVDEASMIDLALMSRLVGAVRADARLILLGDRHQLASVEAGSVLADLVGESHVPGGSASFVARVRAVAGPRCGFQERAGRDGVVQLFRSRRFGENTGVARLASAISTGDSDSVLAILREGDGVEWIDGSPGERAVLDRLSAPFKALARGIGAGTSDAAVAAAMGALDEVRVLCALRRGPLGVEQLGARIAAEVCGVPWRPQAEVRPYPGMPMIVRENRADLGRSNGDVGVVVGVGDDLEVCFVEADGRVSRIPRLRWPRIDPALALTIHQSQGSQFRRVMVTLSDRPGPLLTRELLYTAVTRAREEVLVVAPAAVLRATVAGRVERASGLGDLL